MRKADRDEIEATVGFFDAGYIIDAIMWHGELGCVGINRHSIPFFAAGLLPSKLPAERDAFAFGTDELQGQIMTATRECKRVLTDAIVAMGLNRINAFSQQTHVGAHRWLKLLGFVNAESLPGFGQDGSDFYRFEKLR